MSYIKLRKTRNFSGGSAKKSDDAARRDFHLRAEKLHSARNTMDPLALYRATNSLKAEIAPYENWNGCPRPSFIETMALANPFTTGPAILLLRNTRCPISPYLSKFEITSRIREASVMGATRMSDTDRAREGLTHMTPKTRRDRTEGVEESIIISEESRGRSDAERIAVELPGSLWERTKELTQGNLCTSDQVKIPLIGKALCPGGVGCGWVCWYEKNKTMAIIAAVAASAVVLAVVFRPYATMGAQAAKRLPGG